MTGRTIAGRAVPPEPLDPVDRSPLGSLSGRRIFGETASYFFMAKPVETLMIFATTSPFRQWLALGLGSLCCLLLHPAGLAAQGFRLGRGAAPPRAVVPAPATVTVPAAGSSAGPALREVTVSPPPVLPLPMSPPSLLSNCVKCGGVGGCLLWHR